MVDWIYTLHSKEHQIVYMLGKVKNEKLWAYVDVPIFKTTSELIGKTKMLSKESMLFYLNMMVLSTQEETQLEFAKESLKILSKDGGN